jgi:catechol 2,3-dioxygenase-like lactoylglutathione lyase family enzyme
MPAIRGIAHVELSVSNLDRSVSWYRSLLNANEIFRAGNDEFAIDAVALIEPESKMIIAFTQHRNPDDDSPFTPRRVGLDHVCFGVADAAALEEWRAHLDSLGVKHGGIEERDIFLAIVATDPDGIPMEFLCRK